MNGTYAGLFLVGTLLGAGLVAIAAQARDQRRAMTAINPGSLFCAPCETHWPNIRSTEIDSGYEKCPECGKRTMISPRPAIGVADAWKRKNEAEFERFYVEWDTRRFRDELEAA